MFRRLVNLAALLFVIGWGPRSFGDASWTSQSPSLNIPTHFSASGQSLNNSTDLTLLHDVACTLTVSVAVMGDEVLSGNGSTLATSYMLTCTNFPAGGDATWVASSSIVGRSYHIAATGPVDTVRVAVKGDTSPTHPPEPGDYSATLILTVSW